MSPEMKVALAENSMDRYMAEINRFDVLSRKQEQELALRYRDQGDRTAAHELIVRNLRFVVKVAHEYRGYGLRLLDLVQEGNIGLMKAVKKFDPDKGYRLISYAVWWIRAYIQNFVMRSWSLVKLGTTQAQRKLFFKLRSEREKALAAIEAGAEDTIGKDPATIMAERLGISRHEVVAMEQRMAARDFSLDVEVSDDGRQSHLDLLAANEESVEEDVALRQEVEILREKVAEAMNHFNEKERHIVVHRLLCEDPKTLQEIGSNFGISRERARQIEGNVLRKLRHALRGSGLEERYRAAS